MRCQLLEYKGARLLPMPREHLSRVSGPLPYTKPTPTEDGVLVYFTNIVSLSYKVSLFPSTVFWLRNVTTQPKPSLLLGLHLQSRPGSSVCRVMALGLPPEIVPQDWRDD